MDETRTPYDAWIGRHIEDLGPVGIGDGWQGYYPLIDQSGEILAIAGSDEDYPVVDWVDGEPVQRDGACSAMLDE